MAQLKGAIHLHTNLSHDGTMPLEQLAVFLKQRGYDFIALSDHSYDIDNPSIQKLAEKCNKLSTPEFTIIPGIEFRCHDDIDILGFGVFRLCLSDNPVVIINHIHDEGGVAVLAHPAIRDYPLDKSWVQLLDGCEIWNNQEGKYFPQIHTINKFNQLNLWRTGLMAFCGLDLHRLSSFYPIFTVVDAAKNDGEDILKALKNGEFRCESFFLDIESSGKLSGTKKLYIYSGRIAIDFAKKVRDIFRP